MSVLGMINSAGTTNAGLFGGVKNSLGKEEFLQLLVAQLQYQDPLSPMESQQMASQLAEFGSLEQLQNIGDKLDEGTGIDMILTQAINNTMAASLIGKEVTALGNGIRLDAPDPAVVKFRLNGFSDEVSVKIVDSAGNTVRTLTARGMPKGIQSITWDGQNDNGEDMPSGEYTFVVEAKDKDGNSISATTLVTGLIESVRYDNGNAILIVDGAEINLADVLEVSGAVYSNQEEDR